MGEEFDILLRRIRGIADRQSACANIAGYKHASGTFHSGVRACALKGSAVSVVNMCRPIQTDRNGNVAGLEAGQPFIIDQHAICGNRDRNFAACP
jgi:hypothetical protein